MFFLTTALSILAPYQEQVSTDGAIAAIDAEMAKYSERMDALKVVLYAKFGRSIRLDVDDE